MDGHNSVKLPPPAGLQVCAHSVSWLLDMAAYLEVQPLQDACCEVRVALHGTVANALHCCAARSLIIICKEIAH